APRGGGADRRRSRTPSCAATPRTTGKPCRGCGGSARGRGGAAPRGPRDPPAGVPPPPGAPGPRPRGGGGAGAAPRAARRVKTSPRRTDRLTSSTALVVPNSLVTRSSERTVSVVPGSAPTLVPLLDDRLGDVLRLDDLGQVLLRVHLEELGASGHGEGRIA